MHRNPSSQLGINLVEVLVALAVVAVSLVAASQAYSQWLHSSAFLNERMLASLCAQNTLTAWSLRSQPPALGPTTHDCEQDGAVFRVKTDVQGTANESFRRARLEVFGPSSPEQALVRITTAVGKP